VRGFTEGFTGVLWTAMEELGYAAFTTGAAEYEIDFLARTISPPPLPPVSPDFFDYRDLPQWFDDVGSDLRVVKKFVMNIRFDLGSIRDSGSQEHPRKYIGFQASTEIEADNGNIYRHHLGSSTGFDFPPNPWRPSFNP
jgi:hypothetical protein